MPDLSPILNDISLANIWIIAALEGESANNTPVTFRLPVPSDTTESYVRIVHKNGNTVKSTDFYPVLTDVAGNKYAEITTKSWPAKYSISQGSSKRFGKKIVFCQNT